MEKVFSACCIPIPVLLHLEALHSLKQMSGQLLPVPTAVSDSSEGVTLEQGAVA